MSLDEGCLDFTDEPCCTCLLTFQPLLRVVSHPLWQRKWPPSGGHFTCEPFNYLCEERCAGPAFLTGAAFLAAAFALTEPSLIVMRSGVCVYEA